MSRRRQLIFRRPRLASFVSRVGVWLAAVALVAQTFALAAPMGTPSLERAAIELQALLGPSAVICAEAADHSGAPSHDHDRCGECPACRLAADASILALPAPSAVGAPMRVPAGPLSATASASASHAPPKLTPPARGPPSLT